MGDVREDISYKKHAPLNAHGGRRGNSNRGRGARGRGHGAAKNQHNILNTQVFQDDDDAHRHSRGNYIRRQTPRHFANRGEGHLPTSTRQIDPTEDETLVSAMDDLDLRESIMSKLRSCTYSCLICLGSIMPRQQVWSCDSCFHIFHLGCMTDWALSSKLHTGDASVSVDFRKGPKGSWRCPACQKTHLPTTRPLMYRCFCGKTSRPEYHPGHTTVPHGCDEICGKQKFKSIGGPESSRSPPCPHTCTELCHPGPCQLCSVVVQMSCPCGRVVSRARCGEEPPEPCGAACGLLYGDHTGKCAFGTHCCPLDCHDGDCPPCRKLIKSICYCGRVDEVAFCGGSRARRYNLSAALDEPVEGDLEPSDLEMFFHEEDPLSVSRETPITAIFVGTVFSCEQTCDRPLGCGRHRCSEACHPGDCQPCPLLQTRCVTCPCGRTPLSKLVRSGDVHGDRKKCTDPLPVCPNTCGRPNPICAHPCQAKCHPGPECPPCQLTTQVTCRCGKSSKEVSCHEYALSVMSNSKSIEFLCERICRKKKSCGRHKCIRHCCDMVVHACQEVCGRTLSCRKHSCEDSCHLGPCGTCWRGVINEEIYCHCRTTWLSPPQPCGTAPPDCPEPCSRPHACDHPVAHPCHSEPECPKCTVLMTKRCPGDHSWMFNVACFQSVVTCGRPCDRALPRCSHHCRRVCHSGPCLPVPSTESATGRPEMDCTQACAQARPDCGHPCGVPCHEGAQVTCTKARGALKCRVGITLVCACGRRTEEQSCYQTKALVSALEKKDPNIFLRAHQQEATANPKHTPLPFGLSSNAVLPCDSSCSRAKREAKELAASREDSTTKMWARGGVVDESIPPAFPPPEYSDGLKTFAANNLTFAQDVEKVLYDLVDQALATSEGDKSRETNKCYSHRFIPMKRYKRHFILELADFYGMEVVELDPEPHRHVQVITTPLRARFPGGSKRHYASLSGQIRDSFVGSVKIPTTAGAGATPKFSAAAAAAKPANLRLQDRKFVSFSSVAAEPEKKTSWDN